MCDAVIMERKNIEIRKEILIPSGGSTFEIKNNDELIFGMKPELANLFIIKKIYIEYEHHHACEGNHD